MEKIVRRDGVLYYGEQRCESVDEVYACFRKDYHRSLGRDASRYLNRLGSRKDRIHGFGFVFSDADALRQFNTGRRLDCYFMGLVGISYVRSIGRWNYDHIPDSDFDDYLDWVFSKGSGALRTLGLKEKTGRTSSRLHARYK